MAKRDSAPSPISASLSGNSLALVLSGKGKAGNDVWIFDDRDNDGLWDRATEKLLAQGKTGPDGAWTLSVSVTDTGEHHFRSIQGDPDNRPSQALTLDYLPYTRSLGVVASAPLAYAGKADADSVTYTLSGLPNAQVRVSLNPTDGLGAQDIRGLPDSPLTLDADGKASLTLTVLAPGAPVGARSLEVSFADLSSANTPTVTVVSGVETPLRIARDADELTEGNGTVAYTLTGAPNATVDIALADGTADAADLAGLPDSVVLDAQGTASFAVNAPDDGQNEETETLILSAAVRGNPDNRDTALPVDLHDRLQAPTIFGFSSGGGVGNGDFRNTPPILSGSASDGVQFVEIFRNEVSVAIIPVTNGSWTYASPPLSDGAYEFAAAAIDGAGQESDTSSVLSIVIDTQAPPPATVAPLSTTDATPTLTGSWNAGENESLTILVGGTPYAPETDGAQWRLTLPDALPPGVYNVVAATSDQAGNVSVDASADELKILALNAPTVDLVADDTGAGPNDRITQDATPTLGGSANGAEQILIYRNGTLAATVPAVGGAWSYTDSLAKDGVYDFAAAGVYGGGQIGAKSASVAVVVDTLAPAAATVDPIATIDPTPKLGGTWSGAAGETLSVSVGGKTYAPATDGARWTVSLTEPLTPGNYDVVAKTTDLAGNASLDATAAELTILTSPTPVIAGFDDDTGVGPDDGITQDNTPILNGTAGPGILAVRIYQDGTPTREALVTDGRWSFVSPPLNSGRYTFAVTGLDAAGEESDFSNALTLTVDDVPPTPAVVDPLTTTDTTPTLSGVWSGGGGETLSVAVGGKNYVPTVDGTQWHVNVSDPLPFGTYDIVATTTDLAGNFSVDAGADELTVLPSVPPVIAGFDVDTGISASDGVTRDNTPSLSGAAGGNAVQVRIYANGILTGVQPVSDGAWTYVTPDALADGQYLFEATGIDGGGRESASSGPLLVTIDTRPPAAPTVNAAATKDTTPVLSGAWNGANGETLSVTVGGKTYAPTVEGGLWRLTVSDALPFGTYDVVAKAVDEAGNASVDAGLDELTILPSVPPVIAGLAEDTGANAGDGVTRDNTPTLAGTAGGGAVQVQIYADGLPAGIVPVTNETWTYDSPALADGRYEFSATALDDKGEESAASDIFVAKIDTRAPSPATVAALTTTDATPNLSGGWSGGDGERLEISVGGKTYAPLVDGARWFLSVPDPLLPGLYDIAAKTTDTAGNFSLDAGRDELIVLPLQVPLVERFADDTGAGPADFVTQDNTPALFGTASADIAKVKIYLNGTPVEVVVATGGAWTYFSPELPDGRYDFSVSGLDENGQESAISTPSFSLSIDTQAPIPATVTPLTTSNLTPTLRGTWSGADGDTLSIGLDGKTYAPQTDGSNWSLAVPEPLAYGLYDIVAKTVDLAGNFSLDASVGELGIVEPAPPPPPPPPPQAPKPATVNPLATTSFAQRLSGTWSGIDTDTLNIVVDGQSYTPDLDGADWFLSLPDTLKAGVYNVDAITTNSAGVRSFDATSGELILLEATSGPDTLTGGVGNDFIEGLAGDDQIFGLDGNDTLAGGLDLDSINGGDGNDAIGYPDYRAQGADAADFVDGGAGTDTLYLIETYGAQSNDDNLVNVEVVNLYNPIGTNATVFLSAQTESFTVNILDANGQNVQGGSGADTLNGGGGGDQLSGNDGDDVIEGGPGSDTLNGGAGADRYIYKEATDGGPTGDAISFTSGVDKIVLQGNLLSGLDNSANNVLDWQTVTGADTVDLADVEAVFFDTQAIFRNASASYVSSGQLNNPSAVAAYLNLATYANASAGERTLFIVQSVNLGSANALYVWTDDSNGTVEAGELQLLGVVNTDLTVTPGDVLP